MKRTKLSSNAKAVSLLARREQSQSELVAKLKRAGYELDEIEQTLSWLSQHDVQSNVRFTESLFRRRASNYGNRAIQHELANHGLSISVAQESDEINFETEVERVQNWLERKYQAQLESCLSDQGTIDQEQLFFLKIKVFRALTRRGFAQNNIQTAWKAFIDQLKP